MALDSMSLYYKSDKNFVLAYENIHYINTQWSLLPIKYSAKLATFNEALQSIAYIFTLL